MPQLNNLNNLKNFPPIPPLKTVAFSILALGLSSACQAALESFDHKDAKVPPPFELSSEIAYTDPKSLKLSLGGAARQEDLPVPLLKVEGRLVGISFNYTDTPDTGSFFLRAIFRDANGTEVAALERPVPKAHGWSRFETILAVPPRPEITHVSLQLRSGGQKEGAAIFLDNVRLESLQQPSDFQQGTFLLDSFDQWKKDSFAHERLLFGEGGKQFFDWQKSKFGESCAEFTGAGEKELFQYPMRISSLKISPDKAYTLTFFYNASPAYTTNSALVMATFYNQAGKPIGERPRLLLPKTEDWTDTRFDITPPAGAETVDLSFRLARVKPDVQVYVNRIAFAEGSPRVELQTTINSEKKTLQGQVKAVMAPEGSATTARLVDEKGQTLLTPEIDTNGEFIIDLSKLPDQTFEVIAELSWPEGKNQASSTFTNFNEHPWANDLGVLKLGDSPPLPWKDLIYDAERRQITSWNPILTFSENAGLEQVTLQKTSEDLLRNPVRLLVNGKDIFTETSGEGPLQAEDSPNHVTLTRRLAGDGFVAHLEARAEFDGMVKYRVRIEALRDVTLDSVDLEYAPVFSDGLICADGGWINHQVVDLKKMGHFQTSRFFPMIWTGKQEAGLYVCTESLSPKVETQKTDCHFLNHDGLFTTKFVNQPLELRKGESHLVEYAMGVTPFRPLTKDDPPWRFRAGKYSTGELLWPRLPHHPLFGFPQAPEDHTVIPQWLESAGGQEVRKFNYQIPYFASTSLPQYPYFAKAWHTEPAMIYTAENLRRDNDVLRLNVSQKSWQDIYLQAFKEYFSKYKFGGVYYDCVSFHQGKQPDGAVAYRLFALRDYLQRIYVLQRQLDPESWTFAHSGASVVDFNAVFSDIILTGEHYRGPLTTHRYYLEFLTLEEFRIHNCTEFGPLRMFLPQYKGEKAEAADTATHTLGMVLVHNLSLYPNFVNKGVTAGCRDRSYAFHDSGTENRFKSYWKEGAHQTGNVGVVASVYENSRGALRIYLNTSAERQTISLAGAADSGALTVYDPLHGKTSTAEEGDELTLEPYMMKMVLAAPAEIWSGLP